ncbi:MarR family transcriptional regulator [Victivallis vadensis]|jgi:transcriptional regulator, MarR family|uniref:MarR family transcriptional regulator n=1 Tax=Victivallis vadensis TaxID=172901 RepID=UPI00266BB329|nr:MarR family transcriptional regulator [Victivallis vadensis]
MTADRRIGFLISLIKQYGGRIFEKMLVEHGIEEFNGPQGRILYVLWNKDAIAIQELSGETGLANATLTSMLDRMESKGLIERKPDKNDRRKCLISLTAKAHSLKDAYEEVSGRMTGIYYRGFSGEEISVLEHYLHRVLENVRRQAGK